MRGERSSYCQLPAASALSTVAPRTYASVRASSSASGAGPSASRSRASQVPSATSSPTTTTGKRRLFRSIALQDSVQAILCRQYQLAELAHGPAAAGALALPVAVAAHQGVRIGDRGRKSDPAEHRHIDEVIAGIRDFSGIEAE